MKIGSLSLTYICEETISQLKLKKSSFRSQLMRLICIQLCRLEYQVSLLTGLPQRPKQFHFWDQVCLRLHPTPDQHFTSSAEPTVWKTTTTKPAASTASAQTTSSSEGPFPQHQQEAWDLLPPDPTPHQTLCRHWHKLMRLLQSHGHKHMA